MSDHDTAPTTVAGRALGPRPTTADDVAPADVHPLAEQALDLARRLPGPLRRVAVRHEGASVEVDWHAPAAPGAVAPPAPGSTLTSTGLVHSLVDDGPGAVVAPPGDDGSHLVVAPLVGTFFRSPSPGADPFVGVGSHVETGQTLAIVEAMKLMNPIVADVAGEVLEVLVADGEAVEYEQPLLRVAPAGDRSLHAVDGG